jgi:hypothetical protein
MAGPTRTSYAVSTGVFGPTGLAYIWVSVGYVRSGLILITIFMIWGYLVGVFKRVAEWPLISKITLACGLPLIGLGGYFARQKPTYTILVPAFVYCLLSIAGGLALRRVE